MNNIHKHTDENGNVLILKRINKDRTAYGGFSYPAVGSVVKPTSFDLSNTYGGGGLHGWPWSFGLGDGSSFDIINDTWLVLAAKPENVVGNIAGGAKCKCSEAVIQFEGLFHEAFTMLQKGLSEYIDKLAASGEYSNLAASGNRSTLAASGEYSKLAASGYESKLAASGEYSSLAASGNESKLATSGNWSNLAAGRYHSKLAASGDCSSLAASGYDSNLAASGYGSNLAASGYGSNLAASGYHSKLAASGNCSKLAASGNCSKLATGGNNSNLAASGNNSDLAASGNESKLAASGNCSNLAASGEYSKLAASGDCSTLATSGKDCVIVSAGVNSEASVGENGCFTLHYFNKTKKRMIAVTGYAGIGGIKANTRYHIKNGRLCKCKLQ